MVATRLHGHVEGRAASPLACRLEGDHLCVRAPLPLVPAFPDDLAVGHDDGPDHRVRPRGSPPSLGELERALQVAHASSWTSRR